MFWKLKYWIRHTLLGIPTVMHYRHFTRSGEIKLYIHPKLNKKEINTNKQFRVKSAFSNKNLTKLLFRFLKERGIYRLFLHRYMIEIQARKRHENTIFESISWATWYDIFGFLKHTLIAGRDNKRWEKYRQEWMKLMDTF